MLKTLNIENFTCFPKAELTFSKGLNVIVGENGTGKSHLLKLGYTVLYTMYEFKWKKDEKQIYRIKLGGKIREKEINKDINQKLESVFYTNLEGNYLSTFSELINQYLTTGYGFSLSATFLNTGTFATYLDITVYDGDADIDISVFDFNFEEIKNMPVFFPAKEIMSVYEGFRSTVKNKKLGFDKTYEDFAEVLDVPLDKNVEDEKIKKNIELLEKYINDFRVEYDSKVFYFRKKTDKPNTQSNIVIPANLFAEGHNKLGTLSYLMRNGSIQEGMTLFWDEPEANMNPRLLKALAQILVEMSSYMQIVLSTHSLFLLRELEILQEKKELKEARYFGLHFRGDGTGVEVTQGDTSNEIGNIVALDEDLSQADKYLEVLNGE